MARSSPAISPALHPDKRFLAESGRTVLGGNYREAHSSRHLSQRRRTRTSRARLHPYTEQQPKALFLGDESFHHSGEGSPRHPVISEAGHWRGVQITRRITTTLQWGRIRWPDHPSDLQPLPDTIWRRAGVRPTRPISSLRLRP